MYYIISIFRKVRVNLSFLFNKKNLIDLSEKKLLKKIYYISIKFKPKNYSNSFDIYNIFSQKLLKIIFEKKLTNFLRFSFIQQTLYIHNRFFLLFYLKKLLRDEFNWKKLLFDNDNTGSPIKYFLYPKTTGNLIFQCFHLQSFKDFLESNCFDFDNIFEFGGGYGGMAKIFIRCNKKSKYFIFDLFELSLLQFYFLKKNNFDVGILNCLKNKKNYQIYLIFKYEFFHKTILNLQQNKKNLFIANWSISEIPLSFREDVIKTISIIDYKFITFSNVFENVDNMRFFKNLKINELKNNRKCVIKKIDHYGNNFYFFTKPKI
jgi:hypothetical protein